MKNEATTAAVLGLEADALAACVSCGLCLPHCPTYRATGDERLSPRGRIALMRIVESGLAAPNEEWFTSMETCIQCRGCEPACPSGVPFGELMAATRSATIRERKPRLSLRVGLWFLGHPRLLRYGTRVLAAVQRLGLIPSSALLPDRLPLRTSHPAVVSDPDVLLFSGCVMDVWMPQVHDAVHRVVEATGVTVGRSGSAVGCCGALHEHAGLRDEARRLGLRVMGAIPGEREILVDSAGCGAMLKEYGRLFGTADAEAFSARVKDVQEWLVPHLERLPPPLSRSSPVIVQDPCHLRHVQRIDGATRMVLAPFAPVVELDDEGLCCGAGGAFSIAQPALAAEVRRRKTAAIDRAIEHSGASLVVSANPGCALHLEAVGYEVRHPLEVVAECLVSGGRGDTADGK